MRRRVSMNADELEIGMLVHHPDWVAAPDRVAPIEEIAVGENLVSICVAGTAKPFTVYPSDHVTVIKQ